MKTVYLMGVVLIACGMVFSQDTTTVTPVKIAQKESVRILRGIIAEVDTVSNTVIVTEWRRHDTLKINEKTGIRSLAKDNISLTDLKTGDKVSAYYLIEKNNKVALQIMVKTAMPSNLPSDSGKQ
jgi:Cu/Ag efflux protein CusF